MNDTPLERTSTDPVRPEANKTRLSHVPAFSIRYLLAFTALTALVLTLSMRGLSAEYVSIYHILNAIRVTLWTILVAWTYLGAALILWHAARRTLWPLEPGERLTLAVMCVFTIWFITLLIATWIDKVSAPGDATREYFMWVVWTLPVAIAAIFVVPAVIQPRRRLWSVFFWLLAYPVCRSMPFSMSATRHFSIEIRWNSFIL